MNLNNFYFVLAQGEPTAGLSENFLNIIFHSNILNFLLVIVFIVWISRKAKIFSYISKKQNEIKQSIKQAEKDKVKAELDFETVKKRFRKSDEEVLQIVHDAREIALVLSNKIKDEAVTVSKEIEKKGDRIIEIEKEMAASEVTEDVATAAFLIAEEHIKQAMNEDLHKKYINEFIDSLDNLKV